VTTTTHEIAAPDGRTLHVYDTDATGESDVVVVWHHGTPQLGEPPAPLLPAFEQRRMRCVSYDRPGYGASAPCRGRNVAAAAGDVAAIADALDIEAFATVGISSGGPHALACAALLPDRVTAVVTVAGPAPIDAEGLDWFADMGEAATARMHAGGHGPAAVEAHLRSAGFTSDGLTLSDLVALAEDWCWMRTVSDQAMAVGFTGIVDDVVSMVTPWGFSPTKVEMPVLVLHGARDRIVPTGHGEWLARQVGAAELWLRPGDGHIAVLNACPAALDWLVASQDGAAGSEAVS
jgi:pimeloyl-ACP methyl ester carboxylesterase